MIEQRHSRQDPGTDRSYALIRGGFSDALFNARREFALLGFIQQLLAPIKDQGELPEVLSLARGRFQGPGDCFAACRDVTRNLIIKRLCVPVLAEAAAGGQA